MEDGRLRPSGTGLCPNFPYSRFSIQANLDSSDYNSNRYPNLAVRQYNYLLR